MELTRLRELHSDPAVTVGRRMLTYGQLRDAAGAVADQLVGTQRVAFWAENTLEAITGAVAAVESGVELVPLNPKLGSDELGHILADSQPELIIGGQDEAALSGHRRVTVDLQARGELPAAPSDPERVAFVIYTSGTTGPPKGVLLPRRAVAFDLDALADAWAWTASDRLTHALPIYHAHGLVLGLFGPLRRGGHIHHLARFSAQHVAAALSSGDTMLFAVPTMYHRLAEAAEADAAVACALARARLLVSGSAALPTKTFQRIERATGQRIVERYGLTETLMNTAVRADGERRPGEVGTPLHGVELRLVPEEGGDAPWDGQTMGEIVVRGPNLFRGYLNRPEATAEVVRDGWFWTGDVGTRAPDGSVRIVGRKSSDLIKTGGYKVGAGEVEDALLEHPAVSEASVAGVPDEDLGERIVAWVVLRPDVEPPSSEELADQVASLLAPHKRPREVHVVSDLPRNAMGKVLKQQLISRPLASS